MNSKTELQKGQSLRSRLSTTLAWKSVTYFISIILLLLTTASLLLVRMITILYATILIIPLITRLLLTSLQRLGGYIRWRAGHFSKEWKSQKRKSPVLSMLLNLKISLSRKAWSLLRRLGWKFLG